MKFDLHWKRWIPAIGLMAAIFIFSSLPSADIPNYGFWDTLLKKGGHMTGYALLVAAYAYALPQRRGMSWLALGLAALYAMTDEFHQTFVPGRHGALVDVGIDSLGAWIGILVRAQWMRYKKNSSRWKA